MLYSISKPSILSKVLAIPTPIFAVSTIVASGVLLSSCASTGNIAPQYVAPSTYQSYDCQNLTQEYNRIHSYVKQAQSEQTSFATTGIGVGISAGRWGISPNINIGMGRSDNSQARDAKLARLYGERDAVIQSARIKHCPFAADLKVYGEK